MPHAVAWETDHETSSSRSSADPLAFKISASCWAACNRISRSTAAATRAARLNPCPLATLRSKNSTIWSGRRTAI